MKKNKLGVTYSLFSGEELLKSSILSIRNQVDYINVVWQDTSWTGLKADSNVESLLNDLKAEGLINNILKFEFKQSSSMKTNSHLRCKKESLGVKDLKRAGCTHGMLMDVDEFYYEDEFKKAKDFVFSNKITHSACPIYDYQLSPVYRMRDARDYSVSFIFKLTPLSVVSTYLSTIWKMPCRIDLFRTFPYIPVLHRFYYLNMVSMRHMTGIRKDFDKKGNASISNFNKETRKTVQKYLKLYHEMEKMTEQELLSHGYIKVEDDFGILKEWNS